MSTINDLASPQPLIYPSPGVEPIKDVGRLLLSCADRPGVVSAVGAFLFEHGANVTDLRQHSTDPQGGRLFLRMEFLLPDMYRRVPELEATFAPLGDTFGMRWEFSWAADVKRLAVMVSKADHALQELLWRQQAGDLRAEIVMVISNHDDLRLLVESWGIPFYHVPVLPGAKQQAEERQLELLRGHVDAVILARYMQVLSPTFLHEYPLKAINIHHSFLPAFIGADPYSRAAGRGVKLIGATAHYVTEDLDEGPIIEQDVTRIDHRQSVADLRRAGRYIERSVLARAVAWHAENRVIVHQNKTIVFT